MNEPLLEVEHLCTYFAASRSSWVRTTERTVHAVDDVSFTLSRGEALAVVGESGCGKTTLALTLLGLERPSGGQIRFGGRLVSGGSSRSWQQIRRQMQLIFQDPYESLNPLMRVREIVAEPLLVHRQVRQGAEREQRVHQALADAGLKPADLYLERLPHELSGGQRQRVAIAAALVLEPALVVADEPVSMLDVSIRAEILNLLADLKASRGISLIFITHDLGTVAAVADRLAVMYLGRIVEIGSTAQVLQQPQHPYTQALLSVVPAPNPRLRRQHIILQGETPDPGRLPSGCRFHPRCPVAQPICEQQDPLLRPTRSGQEAACLLLE